MKNCSSCREQKPFSHYSKRNASPDGLCAACKTCVNTRRKLYSSDKEYNKRRYWADPKASFERKEAWYKANPEKKKVHRKQYREANLEAVRLAESTKYIGRKTRVPKWLSQSQKQEIANVYSLRREVELLTGEQYHVDHIVPLQGKNVCGLHVPWNLQILPSDINLSKHNGFSANNQGGVPQ